MSSNHREGPMNIEKCVLMIAYHYPPARGSSGSLRTLNFTKHLPKHDWNPIVLTVHPRAYPDVGTDLLQDIPAGMIVHRAFSLDASRHLSVKGRYLGWTALPDRWTTWLAGGVPAGLRLIRKYRPKVIWSTYPIATSLWIGYLLHRLTGVPWVADLRDPLTEVDPRTGEQHPPDRKLRWARKAIERRAVEHSARTVLVTPGAKRIYAERYAQMPENHWAVIPNGYEEEIFGVVERQTQRQPLNGRRIHLLHSGWLYPTPDRDPSAFLRALASLRDAGKISSQQLTVTLRASGSESHYLRQISQHGLDQIVRLEPAIPYREALKEMLGADGLLVFQGYTSNPAVPAKLYEYLRARRPILAMVDSEGDTAATLRSAGVGTIVPLESSEEIASSLEIFLKQIRQGSATVADENVVRGLARESRAVELAALFDQIVTEQDRKR
jgi:glycosyltransferase involved in cell wall biosynthesis